MIGSRVHESIDFKFLEAHNGDESAEEEADDLIDEAETH